ncbi:MAG TPA: S41 family peptidase [Cyclobacteriaceae bacterium]|nr:S41 family peptidase [Cyclobacteriaceae bacterium]
MRRKLKWFFGLFALLVVGIALREPTEKYFDIARSLDIFATLFKEVNAYYVDEVDPEKLIREGIDGMLGSLDPYTDFISEDEIESFRITTTGQYGGIGALIGVVNDKVVITDPYEGYPANKAGLRIGDEIISIDGKNVKGKSTSDISGLLKGQPKTSVNVEVRRLGKKDNIKVSILREKISIRNLDYHGMVDADVGYLKLTDFTPGAGKEVAAAVTTLKEQGAKKLILDLRDNPGGLLNEAVNIVSVFIPKGEEVVSTKGKVKDWNKTYNTLNNPVDKSIPLVVLTNGGSASASEIVAGALQDYDRAVLIGQRTFGKGLVQTTRPLSYNSQLKVTTAKYYIPSGRCIQELDYTHRRDDGSVDRLADSLRSEFKTRNGRKVFDGGGLQPDIEVKDQYLGAVTIALIRQGKIFEYATKYSAEEPAPTDYRGFRFSDNDYKEFTEWVTRQDFKYSTTLDKNVSELIATAKDERYYDQIENQLLTLQQKIGVNKGDDLERFSDEIKQILETEISFHYGLHQGRAENALMRDNDVTEAKEVLNDLAEYNRILATPN